MLSTTRTVRLTSTILSALLPVLLSAPLHAQTLPYHGTKSSSSTLWWITQTGLGSAGEFQVSDSGNSSPALLALTNGSGPAIKATAGSGLAGDFGGEVRMTGFQLSKSPVNGYVLTSDASGNGSWQKPSAGGGNTYSAGAGLSLSNNIFSIATGGVVTSMLADGAVTAAKIAWPLSKTLSSSGPLLSLTNTSSNDGLFSSGKNGVHGQSSSSTNSGVWGENTGGGYGVAGSTNTSGFGFGAGVWGNSSGSGYGVLGTCTNGPGGSFSGGTVGVYGTSNNGDGGDFYGSASGFGVYGATSSQTLDGVRGYNSQGGNGVRGSSNLGSGVYGESSNWTGGYFTSNGPHGVFGTGGFQDGVFGFGVSGGDGVAGTTDGSGGYAGYFAGDVVITGTLYAGAKNFKIDHPLDPANKYLIHSCVESSEQMNLYRGNVVLDGNGEAIITVPDWFEALNKNFSYQLTCVGGYAPVYIESELHQGAFRIAGGRPGLKVCWQVTGERQDAYAKAHPLEVEQDKPKRERGKFLHPVELGYPREMGIDYDRTHPSNPPTQGK